MVGLEVTYFENSHWSVDEEVDLGIFGKDIFADALVVLLHYQYIETQKYRGDLLSRR